MINLDMIGRVSSDRLFLGGVGTAPSFRPAIEELNRSVGLSLDFSESASAGSDHSSFNAKRIPILFFFAGLHPDYHKPSDTADKINTDGAMKIVSLVYLMAGRIASEDQRPQFTQVQPQRPPGGGAGGYGPWFGSIPDFRDDVQGVLFADVTPNSPAAKAGLRAGDLLVEFDSKPIQNLYDFTYALGLKKPGDTVPVVVKRRNEDVKVNVTLESRR
jgi:membrane-associated protease RseP (regulator of RpoE activity)